MSIVFSKSIDLIDEYCYNIFEGIMNEYQIKILNLLADKNLQGLPLRKIGEAIGLNPPHPQTVKYHLEQLEKRGLISIDKKRKLIKRIDKGGIANTNLIAVPILGAANCGAATMIADQYMEGFLKISSLSLVKKALARKNEIFALEASGDSMNNAKVGDGKLSIEDGDYVIIDKSNKNPHNGNYVLSIIDGMANIKKIIFDKENNRILLLSESTHNYPPIIIHPKDLHGYIINGVVLQVIKKPRYQ